MLLGQSVRIHFGFIFCILVVIEGLMNSLWMYGVHGILRFVGW